MQKKLTEEQLREVIKGCIAESLKEGNFMNAFKANKLGNSNLNNYDSLRDTASLRGAQGDNAAQGANQYQSLIDQYNGEIKKIKNGINYLKRKFKLGTSRKPVVNPLSDEQKAARAATRNRNAALKAQFNQQYGGSQDFSNNYQYSNRGIGGSGQVAGNTNGMFGNKAKAHGRQFKADNNALGNNVGWVGSVNEGFLGNLAAGIRGSRDAKRIEQILAGIKNIADANVAQQTIEELNGYLAKYQQTVQNLQGKLNQLMQDKEVVNTGAQNKAAYDAAWKNYKKNATTAPQTAMGTINESAIYNAVTEAMKKFLK